MVSFKEVTVSAPSKLILHGEHSVVYGKTAIAGSLDLRTRMTISPIATGMIEVDFPDIGVRDSWSLGKVKREIFDHRTSILEDVDQYFLDRIHDFLRIDSSEANLKMASLTCFFYLYSVILEDPVPIKIKVESEIPIGAGLGSSAALSVCLAAGLRSVVNSSGNNRRKKEVEDDEKIICDLAFLSEKILHGNPSGVDNSISTYGGLIKFVGGRVTQLPSSTLPRLRVLLVDSHVQRNTKFLVESVKLRYLATPKVIEPIMEALDGISETCLETLERMSLTQGDTKANYRTLEKLIDYNQGLLAALGVSHPNLDEIVKICGTHGLHAKLTGAGGGGFAYVLIPPFVHETEVAAVRAALKKRGYTSSETTIGVNGVRIQHRNS